MTTGNRLPRRITEWWGYLRSLNEKTEHGKIIALEGDCQSNVLLEVPYKISSGYNFFVTAIAGFCEFIPNALGFGAAVYDVGLNAPLLVTLQLKLDIPEIDLLARPITFSSIVGPELATTEPIELPHPLRIQNGGTVTAIWTPRTNWPAPGVTHARVGVALIGQHITTNELDRSVELGMQLKV